MKAPAHFLRRPKHALLQIDQLAVAIAHHRTYHADSFCMYDAETCTQIEEVDIEYAMELAEVLEQLPAWPG
jgi:hypothetical protein